MKRIAIALGLVLATGLPAAAAPPNVVLILGDDQAWTDFGFMGHPAIQTPHLDRLAAESATFSRGYVPTSLCRASLASIITGLSPHQHHITSNDPPQAPPAERQAMRERMIRYMDQAETLPRWLGRAGYISFQAGKWWEGAPARGGFTAGMTHGDPQRGGRHGDVGLEIGRKTMQPVFDFIDGAGDRPFFLWYAPMLPHQPHNPPDRLLAKYRDRAESIHLARYWAMCEWFDETCGELLAHLDRRGLREKTIVVFAVDNGWIQEPETATFAPKSKRSPYDGGLRTPILVRWPGTVEPRRDDVTAVSSLDLAPTILAACGLPVPASLPGVNLLDRRAVEARPAVQGAIFSHDAVEIDDPARNLQFRWCVEGWRKLILPQSGAAAQGGPELYDLRSDPHETKNLADDEPERVAELRRRLDNWWTP